MRKLFIYIAIFFVVLGALFLYAQTALKDLQWSELVVYKPVKPSPPPAVSPGPQPKSVDKDAVLLEAAYISEAPENNWTGPWKNACEEAVVLMVDKFYEGVKSVSVAEAKSGLLALFEYQNKTWGSNANSDAQRTLQFIKDLSLFGATLKVHPSIEEIEHEIRAGRPVITFNRGFDLHNKNIPFLPSGSSYHTLVIVGFDAQKAFITHDPGDTKAGACQRYKYDVLMNSLHDYNYKTQKADGPPTVLFTRPL